VANNGTVAFTSFANNLVAPGRTSQFQNVFVRKTPTGTASTDIVSVGPADAPGAGPSKEASIDGAGTKVAFTSAANNIGDGTEDANGDDDVFVRDLTARTTKRLTGDLKANQAAISPDGDQVAYAAELGDSDIRKDIFVSSSGGGGPTLVSGCTPCSDLTDRPAMVPSIASDGKVAFQSAARFEPTVVSDQVWVTSGPVAASKDSTDTNLADNVAELGSISGNGNFVAFTSAATNLVPGDFNGSEDVFLKDMSTKAVTRISQRADGMEASGFALNPTAPPAISANGSIVAFASDSSNLVAGDTNGGSDIFVRAGGSTSRISVGPGGAQANGASVKPAMSADGRYVVFESTASNLVPGDNNGQPDVFLHDRTTSETRAVTSSVGQAFPAQNPAISPNGRFIAFESRGVFSTILATNLSVYRYDTATGQFSMASAAQPAPGTQPKGAARPSWDAAAADDGSVAFISQDRDLTGTAEVAPFDRADDVFVQRQAGGPVIKVTVNNAGEPGDGDSSEPALSADGNRVAFATLATNMPATGADANPDLDVYLRDLPAGRTLVASLGVNGGAPGGPSRSPSVNRDGSLVAFASRAENLVTDDSNVVEDVFLANPFTGAVSRLSTRPGAEPNVGQGNLDSSMPAIDPDGLTVAFMSSADNLVAGDTNDAFDTFVRRLQSGPPPPPTPVAAASPPAAPTGTSTQAGDGEAVVNWTAPGDDGGSPITGYRVVACPGGASVTTGAEARSAVVGGLANGTTYTFTVTALNAAGTGSPATTAGIVPQAPPVPPAPPAPPARPARSGYWMLGADGRVYPFGDAPHAGDAVGRPGSAEAVDLEPTPTFDGYWIVDGAGHVFAFGDAAQLGDVTHLGPGERVTSLSATPSGRGYWVFTTKGRVVPFGDAVPYGDVSTITLNGPVLDSIPTPSGRGYYMVASDGGIFTFGDAQFYGSMGGHRLNAPVQSLVPDSDGTGYWLVASDGGIFAFDAPFRGSLGSIRLNRPVTGMVRFGAGYLMVGEDGGIFSFSDKGFFGSLGANPPAWPVVSVAAVDG
jgi:Tol biopolymer transport system component